MTTKFTDFKVTMASEITGVIQSQARALSLADIGRLIVDLPALRERFAKIPAQTYPYLADQLQFLSRVVEEQVDLSRPGKWWLSGVCATLFPARD
jgi:hypothetical protein